MPTALRTKRQNRKSGPAFGSACEAPPIHSRAHQTPSSPEIQNTAMGNAVRRPKQTRQSSNDWLYRRKCWMRTTEGQRGNPAVRLQHSVPTGSFSVILEDLSQRLTRGRLHGRSKISVLDGRNFAVFSKSSHVSPVMCCHTETHVLPLQLFFWK